MIKIDKTNFSSMGKIHIDAMCVHIYNVSFTKLFSVHASMAMLYVVCYMFRKKCVHAKCSLIYVCGDTSLWQKKNMYRIGNHAKKFYTHAYFNVC